MENAVTELIQHLIKPLGSECTVDISIEEGETAIFVDLTPNETLKSTLLENENHYLKMFQHLISVSCGSKKPIVRIASETEEPSDND